MNDEQIRYEEGGAETLDLIGPLWEELNEHHRLLSPHFADAIARMTFAARRESLVAKAARGRLRLDLARCDHDELAGYCVSSIEPPGIGEIESLYVRPAYRRRKIGDGLMKRALAWMDEHQIQTRNIGVAAGNDQAFAFYARYGFHPRCTILRQR